MEELFKAGKEYLERGFSIIPVALIKLPNGKSRKPALVDWKKYQQSPPTLEEVKSWFLNPEQFEAIRKGNKIGIAIITGRVSGNLAVIDFDSKEVLGEFLGELYESNELYEKFITTWIVETGKGFHYYFRVKDPDFKLFHNRIGIREGVDIRAEGGFVVCPPSSHPSGKVYRFLNKPERIVELTWEEYLTLLRLLEGNRDFESKFERSLEHAKMSKDSSLPKKGGEAKKLSEAEILEIVNIIKPIYRQGYRNYVILFLSGWLKKAGVDYSSAKKIIEILAEDDEERDLRLYVLDRTYGLRGNPPSEEELKGKSGLQEIAERLLGEFQSLELIRRLEEKLGRSSPFRDSIFSLIDFSRKMYYVANPRKGIIARAYEDPKNGGIVYKELIAETCPVRVVVYEDPLGGVRKFEIEFDGLLNKTIGPAELETISQRLKAEGVVKHKRLIDDALSSLVIAFLRNGKAEIRRELDKPGFYFIDGELKAVRWEPEEFTKEDLRTSLLLLSELRERWFKKWGEKFTHVIKWGLLAPFSYAIKQIRKVTGVHFPDLVAQGKSNTGKTTAGLITLYLWNPPQEFLKEISVGEVETRAKHGRMRSLTTFQAIVNEVGGIFNNKELLEDFKTAVESRIVRGKHVQGVYQEIPSLRAFYMTSNPPLPLDDSLRRRWKYIPLSYSERVTQEEVKEFEKSVVPRLPELRFIGSFVYERLSKNPELLKKDWKEVSTHLLREAFEFAGLEVPWIDETYQGVTIEEVEELVNEEIRSRLLEDVNQRYSRHISKVEVQIEGGVSYTTELRYRFEALLRENFIPWATLKGEDVVITNAVLKVLDGLPIDSLKSLAERFGWKYGKVRIGKKTPWAVKVPLSDFIDFLKGSGEEDEENRKDENSEDFEFYEEMMGL